MTALGGFLFELWYGRALNANEWMELKLEFEREKCCQAKAASMPIKRGSKIF